MSFTQSARHRSMTTARKERMRDRAERLGSIERRVLASRLLPAGAAIGFIGAVGAAVALVESVRL